MHAGARGNYCKFPDTFHEVIATSIAQARSGNQKQGRTDKYSHSSSRLEVVVVVVVVVVVAAKVLVVLVVVRE